MGRLRAVDEALRAVGVLDHERWFVEEVENAIGGRDPTRPQWRAFMRQVR